MRVLLVAPPRRYWPFISEGDNFLLPQALPWLAASLRARPGIEVRIVDCMPQHMGWRSLAEEIRSYDPDVVACGESHALYASEALRLFRLAAEVVPRARRVAGGAHFSHLPHLYLGRAPIDAIVLGEGEITLVELVEAFADAQPDLGRVAGIAWHDGERIVVNPPRPLVEDLDTLPLPAYDLVPMALYGRSRYLFSPGGTTIHHSRGCTSRCAFCAWWTQMADRRVGPDGVVRLHPRWRTRSVDHVMAEVEGLYHRYGRRSLVWVDESWNIDPSFSEAWAGAVGRAGLRLSSMKFMRADCIVRDEELGINEKLVRAGLSHVLVGVERADDEDLARVNKRFYRGGTPEKAIEIFKRRFPDVFVQATFIVGTRDESRDSLRRQLELAKRLDVDFPAFHPITPVPGTAIFDEAVAEGWLSEEDFEDFDWMTPVLDSRYMSREEIAEVVAEMDRVFVNPRWLARGLFARSAYRRDMYRWFLIVSARMFWSNLRERLHPFRADSYQRLVEPDWYEG